MLLYLTVNVNCFINSKLETKHRTNKNKLKLSKPDRRSSTPVPGTYLISHINYVLQIMYS